jgi:PPOX class probable FMN-dependent enzyme
MEIKSVEELRHIYESPSERAVKKQLSTLDVHAANFVMASPFLILSTYSTNGKVDASPRGGSPGFVKILGEQELLIPDAKGNNRLDSLGNIVETGNAGLLFLVPGMDETLRVNGRAIVSTDQKYLEFFALEPNRPKTCIVVSVEEVFLHCAKALMRSKLWSEDSKVARSNWPTMGQMLKDQIGSKGEPESQKAMLERYRKDL